MPLPPAQIDVDAATYARIVCALLDIPVYGNVIESLHHLFELYLEFANNPHFNAPGRDDGAGPADAQVFSM
jgi:intraflagellar transport protein 46